MILQNIHQRCSKDTNGFVFVLAISCWALSLPHEGFAASVGENQLFICEWSSPRASLWVRDGGLGPHGTQTVHALLMLLVSVSSHVFDWSSCT